MNPVRREQGRHVVYVVEADAGVRDGLCRLLRSAGLDTRPFGAIEELSTAPEPSESGCILLDISAPAAAAPGFHDELRRIGLPSIALSARRDATMRRRARELGSQFFLGKPVDDQALLDAIEWVIEGSHSGAPG